MTVHRIVQVDKQDQVWWRDRHLLSIHHFRCSIVLLSICQCDSINIHLQLVRHSGRCLGGHHRTKLQYSLSVSEMFGRPICCPSGHQPHTLTIAEKGHGCALGLVDAQALSMI